MTVDYNVQEVALVVPFVISVNLLYFSFICKKKVGY